MDEEKKEIEVIKGDSKDLKISTVYEHIKKDEIIINEKKINEEVVIPEGSKKEKNNTQE